MKKLKYTGEKDKNGRKIYDGDIIRHRNGLEFTVEWGWADCMADECMVGWIFGWKGYGPEKGTVIGNIYKK